MEHITHRNTQCHLHAIQACFQPFEHVLKNKMVAKPCWHKWTRPSSRELIRTSISWYLETEKQPSWRKVRLSWQSIYKGPYSSPTRTTTATYGGPQSGAAGGRMKTICSTIGRQERQPQPPGLLPKWDTIPFIVHYLLTGVLMSPEQR
jgi:hypothetical protein